MGALSSEILHFLKVKLPLQNDQRWLRLLSRFSKFSTGGPTQPPFQKYVVILQSNTRLVEKVKYATQGVKHTQVGSTSVICDLLAEDLLYPLLVKYRVGKGQDPGKS